MFKIKKGNNENRKKKIIIFIENFTPSSYMKFMNFLRFFILTKNKLYVNTSMKSNFSQRQRKKKVKQYQKIF